MKNHSKNILDEILGEEEEIRKTEKQSAPIVSISPNQQNQTVLEVMMDSAREMDFNKKNPTYIDKDVHEIFGLLKKETGLSIGNMFSFLGHKFIKENKKEIQELIKNKNKYL